VRAEGLVWAGLAATLVSCAAEETVVSFPPDVATALVLDEGRVRLLEPGRADVPLRVSTEGSPIYALYYAQPAEALLLSADATGELVRAPSGADSEQAWELPPPTARVRYDAVTAGFVSASEAEVASRLADVRVPAPPCPALELGARVDLQPYFTRAELQSLALLGDVAAVTTISNGQDGQHRPLLLLVRPDGAVVRVDRGPSGPPRSALQVFAEADHFLVVETYGGLLLTQRVSTTGVVEELWRVRTATVVGDDFVRWPGTRTLWVRDGTARSVTRLELDTGERAVVGSISSGTLAVGCETTADKQPFRLRDEGSGVVGFASSRVHRFDARSVVPLVAEDDGPVPCQSAHLDFASGGELVINLLGRRVDTGLLEFTGWWRPGAEAAWGPTAPRATVFEVPSGPGAALGIDPYLDDVVLRVDEPRQSSRPPRICDRVGVGKVRTLARDGDRGVLGIQIDASTPVVLVYFRVGD